MHASMDAHTHTRVFSCSLSVHASHSSCTQVILLYKRVLVSNPTQTHRITQQWNLRGTIIFVKPSGSDKLASLAREKE